MDQPYVSFVVTSRNDNHGGDLLRRMQIFLSGLLEQARRFNLNSELIIVEWNPPSDREPLTKALRWPEKSTPCKTRIITVPESIHSMYPYSDKLPLFQMIAKNVGIRRAKGEFILATNIDLLFSDELVAFLNSRKLDKEKMYRIDRYDSKASIPMNEPIQKQLKYCRTHIIRINTQAGTFSPRSSFLKFNKENWVVISGFIHKNFPGLFRFCQSCFNFALLIIKATIVKLATIFRWIRVWFPYKFSPRDLFDKQKWQVFFLNRFKLLSVAIKRIFIIKSKRIHLKYPGDMLWEKYWDANPSDTKKKDLIPGQPVVENYLGSLNISNEDTGDVKNNKNAFMKRAFTILHTNGCGDFTLLSKENWFSLRGYPEIPIFSFNIDSLFCYNAYFGGADEIILRDPFRMYHIEHGSGWTPEQDKKLKERMEHLGIPIMDYKECMSWAEKMFINQHAINFNKEDWGLSNVQLTENRPYE